MAIRTCDYSVTAIKGLRDTITSLGIITTEYLFNNNNWIFKSSLFDKVLQFKQINTAATYNSYMPSIYAGDAFDGSTGVTNATSLNYVNYDNTINHSKTIQATIVTNSTICHIHFPGNGGSFTCTQTFTFGKFITSGAFAFVTTDNSDKGNPATGISGTGSVCRPFVWNNGPWVSQSGNYFSMDFLLGSGNRAIGRAANAKMIASPFSKLSGPQSMGNDVIAPLTEMEGNALKINSNMLILNGAI